MPPTTSKTHPPWDISVSIPEIRVSERYYFWQYISSIFYVPICMCYLQNKSKEFIFSVYIYFNVFIIREK
jgi:hypothetical protein